MDEEKKYIPVLVRHDEKGNMKPIAIEWNSHVVGVRKGIISMMAAAYFSSSVAGVCRTDRKYVGGRLFIFRINSHYV